MQDNPPTPHGGFPDLCFYLEINQVPLSIEIEFATLHVFCPCSLQSPCSQLRSFCRRYSQHRSKDPRFVSTSRTVGIQAVIAQLSKINDCALAIGYPHEGRLQRC